MTEETNNLIALTAEIVAAQVSNNTLSASELPTLIQNVFAALSNATAPAVPDADPQQPAVSIRSSVKDDYIVCLEDGAKLKMLKRYLKTRFGMTPDEYRAKWGLPRDYPMVAPAYAERRRGLAHKIGLGRKPVAAVADVIEPAPKGGKPAKAASSVGDAAPKKRGRPPKAAASVAKDAQGGETQVERADA